MPDGAIYLVHALAWTAFVGARVILRRGGAAPASAPTSERTHRSRHSDALVAFHGLGFGLMYYGLGRALHGEGAARLFPPQRPLGALVILCGAALMCWTMGYFRSWRLRAQIDVGHELATGGPFALVRHPIYVGVGLLSLGTAFWVPTGMEFAAFLVLMAGSDLRARAEEGVLTKAFGEAYTAYMGRTKRFVPGVY